MSETTLLTTHLLAENHVASVNHSLSLSVPLARISDRKTPSHVRYNLYTLWLFTRSDLKTIIVPTVLFGLTNALAAPAYGLAPTASLWRLPSTLIWIWTQLLPFTISNQLSPSAIAEDAINKPWRPLPSNRLTTDSASKAMIAFYVLALGLSGFTGGTRQALGLLALGIWYNHLSGTQSWVVRNWINGAGYVCFTSGAMEVMLGVQLPFDTRLAAWFAIVCGVVSSTIHLADMYDQEGDRMRGRKTLPLVVGDAVARWATVLPMLGWGWLCAWYWGNGTFVARLSIAMAGLVAGRCLCFRTVTGDQGTFRLWNLWMGLVFVLPLLKQVGW